MIRREQGLIKYIGNKTRYAEFISGYFPKEYSIYIEPFFGSGALLGALKPRRAVAIDAHKPLIEMWTIARDQPEVLLDYYAKRWAEYSASINAKKHVYKEVVDSYNKAPNPLDFLFISRTCYGGVLRYRKADGALSTPVGAHTAIDPKSFEKRLFSWTQLIQETQFVHGDFSLTKDFLEDGAIVYCDPPYIDSQKILYGAQAFTLSALLKEIMTWKEKGAFCALSIDGTKRSGEVNIDIAFDDGVFESEISVDLGGSMLKRFQLKEGDTAAHRVTDRLLVTRYALKNAEQLNLQL